AEDGIRDFHVTGVQTCALPILHFSLMGARDLSIISTPPPNRQPVQTELHVFNETLIKVAVGFEIERGGQVFFIHNRVADLPKLRSEERRVGKERRSTRAPGHSA